MLARSEISNGARAKPEAFLRFSVGRLRQQAHAIEPLELRSRSGVGDLNGYASAKNEIGHRGPEAAARIVGAFDSISFAKDGLKLKPNIAIGQTNVRYANGAVGVEWIGAGLELLQIGEPIAIRIIVGSIARSTGSKIA